MRFFLQNRFLTLNILSVVFIFLGIYAWTSIPLELVPEDNAPSFLFVRVSSFEKQSSELLEGNLTMQVEGYLRGLPRLTYFQTTTDDSGVSVSLEFQPKTELDLTSFLIQQGLQGLGRDVTVSRVNPEAISVLKAAVVYEDNLSLKVVRDRVKIGVEGIPGVSKVDWTGLENDTLSFKVPISRIQSLGLSPSEFNQKLVLNDQIWPIGVLKTPAQNFNLAMSELSKTLEQLFGLKWLRSISLTDITVPNLDKKHEIDILHLNGKPTSFIDIFAKDGANLFEIKKSFRELSIPGIQLELVTDRIKELELALDDVMSSLYQAVLITLFVVYFFTRHFKVTLVIGASIPLTILLTVLLLYTGGISLNLLTLSGLILSIGMVVDNAILIIDKTLEMPKHWSLKERTGAAADSCFSSLMVSSITNALIFVPIVFIESNDDFLKILKAFTLPIVGSLLVSVLVAILFIPLGILWLNPKMSMNGSQDQFQIRSEPIFRRLSRLGLVPILLIVFIILGATDLVRKVELADLGLPQDPFVSVVIKFENSLIESQRKKYFSAIEKQLVAEMKELGISHLTGDFVSGSKEGLFSIFPIGEGDIEHLKAAVSQKLIGFLDRVIVWPGVHFSASDSTLSRANLTPSKQWSLAARSRIEGESLLRRVASEVEKWPEVKEVMVNRTEYTRPDYQLIEQPESGLSVKSVKSAIADTRSTLGRVDFENLKNNSSEIRASVSLTDDAHGQFNIGSLSDLLVTLEKGKSRLGSLVQFNTGFSSTAIVRKAGESLLQFKVFLKDGSQAEVFRRIDELIDKIGGDRLWKPFNPMLEAQLKQEKNMNFIVLLSLFLIYVFLASQFESFLKPLAIMVSVPIALIFGVFGLYIAGFDLDVMARLALVLMVGTSVNSAIILFDVIGEYRQKGFPVREAVAKGCSSRFKAVIMTTAIQILSVLPVVFGDAKLMGIPYKTLGIVMVSGTIVSTVVTLVLLPILYYWCEQA